MARAVPVGGMMPDDPLFKGVTKALPRGCGSKRQFSSRKAALEAAQSGRHTGLDVKTVYHCKFCSTWHLSTRGRHLPQKAQP